MSEMEKESKEGKGSKKETAEKDEMKGERDGREEDAKSEKEGSL